MGSGSFAQEDRWRALKDYQTHLEKLRKDAAEAALTRDRAVDKAKRDLFDRLARHLAVLADELERAMLDRKAKDILDQP
jgi:hypothetical protein